MKLFPFGRVVGVTAKGIVAMRTTAGDYFNAALRGLRRSPVLTAILVYSIVFGAAVLMAGFAVWRSTASCPTSRSRPAVYVAKMSADSSGEPARTLARGS
jgi:hypothetical protein